MEELLQQTIDTAAASAAAAAGELTTTSTANGVVFLLISALGLLMALVYVPVRIYLTVTARSRRLRLLQRIRRLRDDLGQPYERADLARGVGGDPSRSARSTEPDSASPSGA